MVTCSSLGCTHRSGAKFKHLSFHKFPLKNEALLAKWLLAMQRDFVPSIYSALCSDHFSKDCFIPLASGHGMLRDGSVPSIFETPQQLLSGSVDEGREERDADESNAELPPPPSQLAANRRADGETTPPAGHIETPALDSRPAETSASEISPLRRRAVSELPVDQSEAVSSVKVEVLPDVDILLGNQSESDEEESLGSAETAVREQSRCRDDDQGSRPADDAFVSRLRVRRTDGAAGADNVHGQAGPQPGDKPLPTSQSQGVFRCGGHDGKPCPRVYRLKSSLKKHMRRFARVRDNTCSICGADFEFASSLTRHATAVHKQVGQHGCSVCGKLFVHAASLLRHAQTHSSLREHRCPVCGRSFAYRDALASHARTHSDKREHRCPVCDRAFAKRANMASHARTHGRAIVKACAVCGRTFAQQRSLNSHLLKRHAGAGVGVS